MSSKWSQIDKRLSTTRYVSNTLERLMASLSIAVTVNEDTKEKEQHT